MRAVFVKNKERRSKGQEPNIKGQVSRFKHK